MAEALPNSVDAYLSPPVLRAARLLRHIAEGDTVTNMSQTGRALGINRTTLLRLLHSLEAERFIEPVGAGQGWKVGLGLIGLAAQAFFSDDLFQTGVPAATRLVEMTGLSAHLGVLDCTEVVYMIRRTPNQSFASNIRVGTRLPAHATSMGRIILAYLPWSQVGRLYAGTPMPAATEQTPVTPDQLRDRLEQDRAAGLAWSRGFYEAGISSVAAAVFDAAGAPVAALNVIGQSAAFDLQADRDGIAAAIRATAEDMSRRLGWGGAMPRPLARFRFDEVA